MSELVTTYNLTKNPEIAEPMDRKKFYKEQTAVFKKTGKPSRAVAIVNVFLFNQHGELFVQKRSRTKAHNPGLLDKSIGGHVQYGDTPQYTVMVETVQELQVPSVTLPTEVEFKKTFKVLTPHLNTVSVLQFIDSRIHFLTKIIDKKKVDVANRYFLYFGIYAGATKTVDRESKGVLLYDLDDLFSELTNYPNLFTEDIKFYSEKYKKEMMRFIKLVRQKYEK